MNSPLALEILAGSSLPQATLEEWLAIPEEARAELIDGQIVYHAMPGPRHGRAQGELFALLRPYGRRFGGGDGPGGWWFSQEVDMEINGFGCRPDVQGWRREKHLALPEPDARGLTTVVPDWICEVLSPSTARYDLGKKRSAYFRAGVEFYWLVDYSNQTFTALRRTEQGYVIQAAAGPGETVQVDPFGALVINVGDLFEELRRGFRSCFLLRSQEVQSPMAPHLSATIYLRRRWLRSFRRLRRHPRRRRHPPHREDRAPAPARPAACVLLWPPACALSPAPLSPGPRAA